MRRKLVRIPMFIALAAVFVFLFGYFVMHLWNWLMPALFGLHVVTFWQAMGILILAKILFGGFRGGFRGGHGHWRDRMRERWGKMTPEEQERFRQTMRDRCGPWSAPDAAPKA